MSRIVSLTSIRGWVLIVAVAVAAYVALGAPGVAAWIAGALAAMSASEPWEEDSEDERLGPWVRDEWRGSRSRPHDDRLRFSAVYHPTPRVPLPVYR